MPPKALLYMQRLFRNSVALRLEFFRTLENIALRLEFFRKALLRCLVLFLSENILACDNGLDGKAAVAERHEAEKGGDVVVSKAVPARLRSPSFRR